MHIGPFELKNRLALAPMAGVTDLPFRLLCKSFGADIAAGEMLTSDSSLWHTDKSRRRMAHRAEPEPRVVQIAGADPRKMADAAQMNADAGAQIIDINMGCPAKKVCNVAAGSALLRDEELVRQILFSVVSAVTVPVTLKIRTGWDCANRNGVRIARIAQDAGVQALAVHGRTRACKFAGDAEYATIRAIKQAVDIPVFANGDIDSALKAHQVLQLTGADGVMIGRSAQGKPWIFREIDCYLRTGIVPPEPSLANVRVIMLAHLRGLHDFYGEEVGVRVARKHIGWYAKGRADAELFRHGVMQAPDAATQLELVQQYFELLESNSNSCMDAAA
jgi:tRNA-dihydrouridine synthase B